MLLARALALGLAVANASATNFRWSPADKAAFVERLNGHLNVLAPLRSQLMPVPQALSYLNNQLLTGNPSVPQLAADRALAQALGSPRETTKIVAPLHAESDSNTRTAAQRVEALALQFVSSYKQLNELRRSLVPQDDSLDTLSREVSRAMTMNFGPQAAATSSISESADRRFGTFNQYDQRLEALQLFPDGDVNQSGLCGPVCVVNAMRKFETVLAIKSAEPSLEVAYLASVLAPALTDVVSNGVSHDELMTILRGYLRQRTLKASVKFLEPRYVAKALLEKAADNGMALIISYERKIAGKPSEWHYVLATGFQAPASADLPSRLLIQDPASGEATARLFHSGAIQFEDPHHPENNPPTTLRLDGAIVITLKQPTPGE
jgi:hypothetical protein